MKIKCPHCGATNQDVTENDPCWQCGTILSAPTSALTTAEGPPTSAANTGSSSPTPAAQTPPATQQPAPPPAQPRAPQTIQRPAPAPPAAAPVPARSTGPNWIAITVILVILLAIVIGVLMLRH